MDFFTNAIDVLQTLVIALGGGLCVWGGINLLEGYGQDNPASKSQGIKQLMAGGGVGPYRPDPDPPAVRPALRLMSASKPHGRPRHTGPPGKEVIPVDL